MARKVIELPPARQAWYARVLLFQGSDPLELYLLDSFSASNEADARVIAVETAYSYMMEEYGDLITGKEHGVRVEALHVDGSIFESASSMASSTHTKQLIGIIHTEKPVVESKYGWRSQVNRALVPVSPVRAVPTPIQTYTYKQFKCPILDLCDRRYKIVRVDSLVSLQPVEEPIPTEEKI